MIQNRQIDAYLKKRDLKQHEKELLKKIKNDYPVFKGNYLDIGCSNGNFIKEIYKDYPDAQYIGIDISEDLIEMAKNNLTNINNISFFVQDFIHYQPGSKFDIIVASGVLSIFENFETFLDKCLSWLSISGRLYIFGRFNSRNIDTIVRFRNNYRGGDWESGLTSFSVHTISNYLDRKGFKYSFNRFKLDVELKEANDPIRTYTIRTADESLLVVNGANIVAEHYFLTVFL